jgi:peptide/nickel transport system substrate-binding protein
MFSRWLITYNDKHIVTIILILVTLSAIACGAAAPANPSPADNTGATEAPQPAATTAPSSAGDSSTPTPVPQATSAPVQVDSAKDTITLVTQGEPPGAGTWDNCSGNVPGLVCSDVVVDPLTWIDSDTKEVVALSGTESWEQIEPNRWRFRLREGVKFHNGEPWNAAAAKMGIDINGTVGTPLEGFGFHGEISGEVVDDMTVDVVCAEDCPIFPRTALWTSFQAPEWYASAPDEDRQSMTVSFGPYKMVEWDPGVQIRLEAYEDYLPNEAFDSQQPTIPNVVQVWRIEPLVRASMVAAGEADWAAEIGAENQEQVPQAKSSTNSEIFLMTLDTVWHPELSKKPVRQALAHAIDCEGLVEALYGGLVECFGNTSAEGTIGITPENSAPYEYNPEMAQQLLQEAGYDPANEIRIYTREGRVAKDIEFYEGVANFWREIGVNTKIHVLENAVNRDMGISGCGQHAEEALRCHELSPPPPYSASSHAHSTATSNETLDYARQAILRQSCFAARSKICDPSPGGLEEKINVAKSTPLGDLRRQRLEEIATLIRDEYYFIPHFQVVVVYGLAPNLEWEPRYDPRTRVNVMRFTQ